MLQLKCTAKVQTLLKLKPSELQPIVPSDTPLGDWFVNVLMIDRRKTFLLVNEKTASSFIMYGFKQAHIPEFANLFLHGLNQFLVQQGVPADKIDFILKGYHDVAFTKTDSKQVLGFMNELALHYENHIWHGHGFKHCNLNDIIQRCNQIPFNFKTLGYQRPTTLLHTIIAQL